jgi:type II secretory pathway pseudopilin PulG
MASVDLDYSTLMGDAQSGNSDGAPQYDQNVGNSGGNSSQQNTSPERGSSVDEIDNMAEQYQKAAEQQAVEQQQHQQQQQQQEQQSQYQQPQYQQHSQQPEQNQYQEPMAHNHQDMSEQDEYTEVKKPKKSRKPKKQQKTENDTLFEFLTNKTFLICVGSFLIVMFLMQKGFVNQIIYKFIASAFNTKGQINNVGIVIKCLIGLIFFAVLSTLSYTFT